MEIGPDKTKVMTNNPNGFQREIEIKGQRLEEVENFKYLGAIISNEGSKPEILSSITQTTAALCRLKIIWRDKTISHMGFGDSLRAAEDREGGKILLQRHLWCPDDLRD